MEHEKRGTWRYVASRSRDAATGEILWEVRELYSTQDGGFGSTEDAISAAGETLEELRRDLANMLKDTERPIQDLTVDPARLIPLDELIPTPPTSERNYAVDNG